MEKTKKIIIKHIGPIAVMNSIQGPILQPFEAKVTDIMHLVVTGYKTYEVLSDGTQVRLTLDNYNKNNNNKKFEGKRPAKPVETVESKEVKEENQKIEDKDNEVVEEDIEQDSDEVVESSENVEEKHHNNNNNRNHNNNYKKNKNRQ